MMGYSPRETQTETIWPVEVSEVGFSDLVDFIPSGLALQCVPEPGRCTPDDKAREN